ncbi:hypothetical protein Patl1_20430 [Pistacia atlantica]|uniref:Uncharacterized protein n=1 Tax=Pistacia atlantica TaxID=434234 RepID=A0ACC1BMK6_9ROSI|nr:hypothetical protein Patl1_20430 [Pistacia atlantica]
MGDSEADVDNPVMKEEQMPSSVIHNHVDKSNFCRLVKGSRGDVTITILRCCLRAIYAGFEEPIEPAVCLSGGKL